MEFSFFPVYRPKIQNNNKFIIKILKAIKYLNKNCVCAMSAMHKEQI